MLIRKNTVVVFIVREKLKRKQNARVTFRIIQLLLQTGEKLFSFLIILYLCSFR